MSCETNAESGYEPAVWRGTTGMSPLLGSSIAVSFETERGVVRLLLNIESARHAAGSILRELRARSLSEVVTSSEWAALEACQREDPQGDCSELLGAALGSKYGLKLLTQEDLLNVNWSDVEAKT